MQKALEVDMSQWCPLCLDAGQPLNFGSPRGCAFTSGTFSTDNWNCATMNALREIAEERGTRDRWDDSSLGFLPLPENAGRGWIILAWYKDRGRTDRVIVWSEDTEPAPLTLEAAALAIAAFTPSRTS